MVGVGASEGDHVLLPPLNVQETGNNANLRSCGRSMGIACASARSHEWNDQDIR